MSLGGLPMCSGECTIAVYQYWMVRGNTVPPRRSTASRIVKVVSHVAGLARSPQFSDDHKACPLRHRRCGLVGHGRLVDLHFAAQDADTRSYTWLKWVAAAVLFVEAFVGVALPYLMRITASGEWYLSLANAFAGGAFFTFGARSTLLSTFVDMCKRQDDAMSGLKIVVKHLRIRSCLFSVSICMRTGS